jgi:hypothetical protein
MKKKSPASSIKNRKRSDWLKPRRTVLVNPQEAVTMTIAFMEMPLVLAWKEIPLGFALPALEHVDG